MNDLSKLEVGRFQSSPLIVSSEATVSKIIGTLKEANAYEVFTVINKRIGMVTTRDILGASNIGTTKTSNIVKYVPMLMPTDKLIEAARLMSDYRIRALPIVEDDDLIGVVHILAILPELKTMNHPNAKINSIMTPQPITINAEDSAMKARKLMLRRRFDHLPVLKGGVLAGVLTSSHVVYNMIQSESPTAEARGVRDIRRLEFPAQQVMDKDPVTANVDEKIPSVLDMMLSRKSPYAVVSLVDEVQGIVTYRDYMKLIPNLQKAQDVEGFIMGLPDDPYEAELAKKKFAATVQTLKKSFPDIEEASSKIKASSRVAEKERKRYEVSVSIITPRDRYSYSGAGWDLPAIYDELANRIKRLMSEKNSPMQRRQEVRGER